MYNNDNTKVLLPSFLVVFDAFLMVGHFRTNTIPLNFGVTRSIDNKEIPFLMLPIDAYLKAVAINHFLKNVMIQSKKIVQD